MNILNIVTNVKSAKNINSSFDGEDVVQNIAARFSDLDIKCNFDAPSTNHRRMLLYTKKGDGKSDPLKSECNGTIINYETNKVLCYPSETVSHAYNKDVVNADFDKYTVYKASDGTISNLYYYCDKWCISTMRGIEVNAKKWMDITYNDAIADVFKQYLISFDDLDKSASYSFGFSHPKMHVGSKINAWFISTSVLGEISTDKKGLSLPSQETTSEFKSLRELIAKSRMSDGKCVGYILRSTEATYKCVFVESLFMEKIRKLVYDRNIYSNMNEYDFERQKYLLTITFLDPMRKQHWLSVFPHNKDIFDMLESEVQTVVDFIHSGPVESRSDIVSLFASDIADAMDLSKSSKETIRQHITFTEYAPTWYVHFWKNCPTLADLPLNLVARLVETV
jgi:hypothetical protein